MYRNWGYLNPRHVYHGDDNHQLNKKKKRSKNPELLSYKLYKPSSFKLQASRMMDRGRDGIQVKD